MSLRKLLKDPVLQMAFEKDGYVVVDLLSERQILEITKRYHTLKPSDGFTGVNDRYHCTFIDTDIQYKREAYLLFQSYFEPFIQKLLIDYRMLTGSFYVKQPGGGEFEIHQNWNVLDEEKHTSVTIWIPLQNTTELNGTIEVVPGSNKIINNINALHAPSFFNTFENKLKEEHLKSINLNAGQAIIFDDNIVHYSKGNRSASPRTAIQLICIPEEAQPLFYYVDPADRKNIHVYEADSEFYYTHDISHVINHPPLKWIEKFRNKNVSLTEKQFIRKLKQGEKVRRNLYNNFSDPTFIQLLKRRISKLF